MKLSELIRLCLYEFWSPDALMQEHVRCTSCKVLLEERRSFIVIAFNFCFILCHSTCSRKPKG